MKLLIQLMVAVAIVVACARAAEAAWRFYEFKDAIEQEARFGEAHTTTQLHRRVLELAQEYNLAVAPEEVAVKGRGELRVISASYVEPVVLLPGFYTRDHRFELEVSVRGTRPLIVDTPPQ